MRRPFSICVLLLYFLFLQRAMAQVRLMETVFTPATFTVGDVVELRLVLSAEGGSDILVPDQLPTADWIEIREIRVEKSETRTEIFVSFVSFAPGTRTLPLLDLGALRIGDIKVTTASVLDAGDEKLRGIRGQLMLIGTRLVVALLLTFSVLTPILIWLGWRLLWKSLSRFHERYNRNRPARRLRRLLKRLGPAVELEPASSWYSDLTDGLRVFLSMNTGRDCRSSTTGEIAMLPGFSEPDSPKTRVIEVLREGDMVKFAGREVEDSLRYKTLTVVEEALKNWDQWETDADL